MPGRLGILPSRGLVTVFGKKKPEQRKAGLTPARVGLDSGHAIRRGPTPCTFKVRHGSGHSSQRQVHIKKKRSMAVRIRTVKTAYHAVDREAAFIFHLLGGRACQERGRCKVNGVATTEINGHSDKSGGGLFQ
jgi:hypothetical protein